MSQALRGQLAAQLRTLPPGPIVVGLSGGLDSSVLLHLLASTPAARQRGLSALHIDHGSAAQAAEWARHCRKTAERLNVDFHTARAAVDAASGLGLEGAWRAARYACFEAQLPHPAILALAHHAEDQIETLLLRLLHGAGSEGLAGMRRLRPLVAGDAARWLWRPLLEVRRPQLEAWAQQHDVTWVDDPANLDPRHARTRLRTAVWPALAAAFPDAGERILDSARRLRAEADALDWVARRLLAEHLDAESNSLGLGLAAGLPDALLRQTLGLWLDQLGLPRPPPGIWRRLRGDLVEARPGATPSLHWRGARLRRHRGRLYADDGQDPQPEALEDTAWDGRQALHLAGLGLHLSLEPPHPEPARFQLRLRRGGERLRHGGRTRSVKQLLQEAGVPAWERARLPLLFDADGALCSVAGRWHSDAFAAWLEARGQRLRVRAD